MKRNFLLLYLNTGGGHVSPAKVFKDAVVGRYPEATVTLLHGFSANQHISKSIWEKGYETACDLLPGAYSLTYDAFKVHALQSFGFKTFFPGSIRHITEKILELEITDIISFHFILTPCALKAVHRSGKYIPVTSVVTDPFSPHPIWFYPKNTVRYIFFSPEVRKIAEYNHHITEKNNAVMPFFVDKRFFIYEDAGLLKKKYGFNPDKPVVLLTGGGGGLPLSFQIVRECLRLRMDTAIAVVCGRNKRLRFILEKFAELHPEIDLHVYGFVSFMSDLVQLCDCAVTKAGASTLFEMFAGKKPVIICSYIHGQELGNVRFTVQKGVGWFISKPDAICKKISQLLNDTDYCANVNHCLAVLNTQTDMNAAVEFAVDTEQLCYGKKLP